MKVLIPEIQLEIYNAFDKLMENGKDRIQFEIITLRDGARIPLLFESSGIKKLISICSNLVSCYNRESYCLVVDELYSGIYEYLLGECLEVMQEKATGQLIFTSHNLRPLEVLENELLIYTTVNPENRYIKSTYIKNTQNTRLSYLRSIKLGGQKENCIMRRISTKWNWQCAEQNHALIADVGKKFYELADTKELYVADGCHPNEEGSRIAAETIAAVLLDDKGGHSA